MQLTPQTAVTITSANRWPWIGLIALVMLIVFALIGIWIGQRWQKGTAAAEENTELRADIQQLQTAIAELRDYGADVTLAYDQAAQRLDNTADEREQDREANRKNMAQLRGELERLLQDRPDLRSGRAGDDVLQHWNKSNARPGTAPTAPDPAGEPAPAVPGPATSGIRSLERPAGEPRRSDGLASRLPEQQGQADRGNGDLGGNGMAMVLHGAGSNRDQDRRMPA